jgi:hypothetical protein
VIGLGAVGAAFSWALASAPGLSGNLVGIDPQTTGETDRNRLLSMFYSDVGIPKAMLAARLFDQTALRFYPNETRWPEYATDPARCSPPDIRSEEERFRYSRIISCVDRNIHRQNIARFLPQHVLSGSTDGLVAQATYYAMIGPCECLACNHPVPTFDLERFVQELKGLSRTEQLAKYLAWELAPEMTSAIDEYLHNPACGQLVEAELRRLGVDGATDWSVGFVSAAAGVMLAAYFARFALESVEAAVGEMPERRLIFLGEQELMKSRASRKPDCPLCGEREVRGRFLRRWHNQVGSNQMSST